MWYIVIIMLLMVGYIVSCKQKAQIGFSNNSNILDNNSGNNYSTLSTESDSTFTKKEIEAKLKKLSETPEPTELSMGAMCYSVAIPPDTASYICPTCGERTLYKVEDGEGWDDVRAVQRDISECRYVLAKINGVNLILDESQYCKKCSPNIEKPELCLLVNYANSADTNRICGISPDDLKLIDEFLSGSDRHLWPNDAEAPLKDYIDRIRELLGVDLKNSDK